MAPSKVEKGFIRTKGRDWLDPEGRPFLLRGVGLGSWFLPEGYMWKFPKQADRPRRMEGFIQEWIGEADATRFWELYYANFVTEDDIVEIAAQGFNSVRVPLQSRLLLAGEAAWELLDALVGWCRTAGVYVILDLHGAPGGQTGTNIDDSESDLPELFTNPDYRLQTVDLWRRLARRYRDEPIVAGYDLLNEPLPNWFSQYNDLVMPLYKDLIRAIREEDEHHTIILEGVHWATDWSIFTEIPDDNLVLEFHKYWNNPDTDSLRPYLQAREHWNVPIFMGEGGENNVDWYVGAFRLFEDHGISWNFWTWKKMETGNSPFSIQRPRGWQALVESLETGVLPSRDSAKAALFEFAENLKLSRCTANPDVARAVFSCPPVRIPAVFYGFRGPEVSFHSVTPTDREFRRGDGPILLLDRGTRTAPNFQHGAGEAWKDEEWVQVRLLPGDWVTYATLFRTPQQGLHIRLLARTIVGPGRVRFRIGGHEPLEVVLGRGGWEPAEVRFPGLFFEGEHVVRIEALGSTVDLEWLELSF